MKPHAFFILLRVTFYQWEKYEKESVTEPLLKTAKKSVSTSFRVRAAPKRLVEIHNHLDEREKWDFGLTNLIKIPFYGWVWLNHAGWCAAEGELGVMKSAAFKSSV